MKTLSITILAALAASVNANICGKKGYDDGSDAYYYNDSDNQGSLAACSKQCSQDTKCKSFAFNKDTCMLFDQCLDGRFEADDSSTDTFYDRACLVTTSTSAKISTSTLTSTKTTTHTTSEAKTTSKSSTSAATSKSSTTLVTSTKSASATPSSPAIPPGCTSIPDAMIVNSFSWFNSTHNLDCAASHPDVGDGTGCLDENGQWCDPKTVANCTHCGIGVCMTGLPPQPVGYGPPDDVKFGFTDGTTCEQGNPQGFKNFEVGEGHMQCGPGSWPSMGFTANSESAKTTGDVSFSNIYYCNDKDGNSKSYIASYNTKFAIDCKHDVGHNATCTTPQKEVRLPLTSLTLLN